MRPRDGAENVNMVEVVRQIGSTTTVGVLSEGGTGENQRIDPHLNFGIFHREQ